MRDFPNHPTNGSGIPYNDLLADFPEGEGTNDRTHPLRTSDDAANQLKFQFLRHKFPPASEKHALRRTITLNILSATQTAQPIDCRTHEIVGISGSK